MAKSYTGKAPLTVVRADNRIVYVEAGQAVPAGASDEELARLLEGDFIVEAETPGGYVGAPLPEKATSTTSRKA